MLGKLLADLRRRRNLYELANDLDSPVVDRYYFVFREDRVASGKDQALIRKFDADGIPLNKTYIDVDGREDVYFPISIGQMGLAVFHTFLETQSETDRTRFLKFADWFVRHAEHDPECGARWMTHVPLPQYGNPGPWQSAFSQSRGISILVRAFRLTREKRVAELAESALIPFTRPVDEGGVTVFTPWGPFYEEYPASAPTLVLNGMIFALCGVQDFVRVFPDHPEARRILEDGIRTLEGILPEYDLGYWSRYNLCRMDGYPDPDPATLGYQRLHVVQLEMLHRLTGKDVFREFAERFRKQDRWWNALRMYRIKHRALRRLKRL
ncbi:MAG TPA: hypothetical protein ENN17_08075 [bacterium]|nr:hypothetical protein [bacterium]